MGTILLGRGREMTTLPQEDWELELAGLPERMVERLAFMSEDHHRVRYFVVAELPRRSRPLGPDLIARELELPLEKVGAILNELEKNLFFLTRNGDGAVAWAYPLTVERTPHHLTWSSGERLYAAWAEDAVAAPFVQGHLWKKKVSVEVSTECAHCGEPLHLALDSDGGLAVREEGAQPLVFHPDVDWSTFSKATIIHDYWKNSVFFWSEEHARDYRRETLQIDGTYLTLAQNIYLNPISQGGLFGFTWSEARPAMKKARIDIYWLDAQYLDKLRPTAR